VVKAVVVAVIEEVEAAKEVKDSDHSSATSTSALRLEQAQSKRAPTRYRLGMEDI
jgi:hypothetical protein